MKRIVVTGGKGQLAQEFKKNSFLFPQFEWVFKGSYELDITDYDDVERFFMRNEPDIIINCAAYTKVDEAEREVDLAFKVNEEGVKNLAELCLEYSCQLIHFSTDYVFDGQSNKAFLESDLTNPVNMYGMSKLKGELAIKSTGLNAIIFRTSWLYSDEGKNFVNTIIGAAKSRNELNVVIDQIGTPTYAKDLVMACGKMISDDHRPKGVEIYHFSNEGIASWYDFAYEIVNQMNLNCEVKPSLTNPDDRPAPRPYFSVLNKAKFSDSFQIPIRHWREALAECLNKKA